MKHKNIFAICTIYRNCDDVHIAEMSLHVKQAYTVNSCEWPGSSLSQYISKLDNTDIPTSAPEGLKQIVFSGALWVHAANMAKQHDIMIHQILMP